MQTFLVILLIAAMIATVVALVRGVVTFLQAAGAEARGDAPSALALKSNKMMQQRILFQALAIVVVVILLATVGGNPDLVKLTKIYTRTGDGGSTGLVDGSRTAKHSLRIAAIGEVDEANSAIGVAIAGGAPDRLRRLQNDLFDLGADLATPGNDFIPSHMVLRIVPTQVAWLEAEIDRLNADLAPLTSFILPGGAGAAIHLARAIVRRAERAATALAVAEPINPQALAYLNRLSDYLFVLARHVNHFAGGDVLWVPGGSRG